MIGAMPDPARPSIRLSIRLSIRPAAPVRARPLRWLAAAVLLASAAPALAQHTARLPASACSAERIFHGGFDRAPLASGGAGGSWPGDVTRAVVVGGEARQYLLHVPTSYRPGRPMPLLVALHGAPGSAALAPMAAETVRTDWSAVAHDGGFLVLATIASGASGGWSPQADTPMLAAALDDVAAAYSVDVSRVLLWGYSAGGHWGYDLALRNPDVFAGFGASAGALQGYACDTGGAPACTQLLAAVSPRLPVVIRVGGDDTLREYVRADRGRLATAGWQEGDTLDYAEFAGAHVYETAQLHQVWSRLCRFAVDP